MCFIVTKISLWEMY